MSRKNTLPYSDNPFLSIDKSQFAKSRPAFSSKSAHMSRRKNTGKPASKAQSEQELNADAAYFSHQMCMGGVKKLGASPKVDLAATERDLHGVNELDPADEQSVWAEAHFGRAPESQPGEDAQAAARRYSASSARTSRQSMEQPGQADFGSMAEQLKKVKVNDSVAQKQIAEEHDCRREQEDQMLKEYLASASMKPKGLVKAGAADVTISSSEVSEELAEFQSVAHSEEDEFSLAMREVAPLTGKGRDVAPEPPIPNPSISVGNPLQDFLEGKVEFSLEYTDEFIAGHVLGLDPAIMGKFKAGSFSYEAHLDLHGLNSLQAFESLVAFIKKSYMSGKRTVLLIPGRGRNSPDGTGILREKLQEWLIQEPFKRVVLAFATALPKHGGPGAVYVMLRKLKKSRGKIRWDYVPKDPDLFV